MKKKKLYPITFDPIPVERVWGTESWDIASLDDSISAVSNGFLSENSLADLMEVYLSNLVGDNIYDNFGLLFPLLVKSLDVKGRLSVQAHPDDITAMEREYWLGKTEFWYVLDADPDAVIYLGFNRDVTPAEFYERCMDGSVEGLLNAIRPKKGDCFLIRAGEVHAAAGGVRIAEIQENSDITYRLYDWGREFNPETRREMHLGEAIDIINFKKFDPRNFLKADRPDGVLVQDSHFNINVLDIGCRTRIETDRFTSFLIYVCVEGGVAVSSSSTDDVLTLRRGQEVLVPAEVYDITFDPLEKGTRLLQVDIPQIEEEADPYINPDVASEPEGLS